MNKEGIEILKHFEGCELTAYICPAKKITIGYGNTYYQDKSPVKIGDTITQEQADILLEMILVEFETGLDKLITVSINENQRSALISFAYNLGVNALKNSTLLKKVNGNPNDPTIVAEFLKWNKGGGKVLAGLTRRRQAEAALYCK